MSTPGSTTLALHKSLQVRSRRTSQHALRPQPDRARSRGAVASTVARLTARRGRP
eukprot:CAMPEP_0118811678 /NCGR_PEP_ID=MMETSP1162-20130426/1798_1 /TAXON_ID=33656 /ORGANISM="Phaeocystis Sp, Strain CCMP2710" /LENGTH=54 /DNA_ID=CAMNT_0006741333 /DNA_START=85 /DNA_END=245 /DNA_ORIENTATION=+